MKSLTDENWVTVARIGAPHGVKGEVRVQAFTENPFDLASYSPFQVVGKKQALNVASARPQKNMLVMRFEEVKSREAAEALKGTELAVPRDRLPDDELEEDEFFIADLIGMQCQTLDGKMLGKVHSIDNFGAGDVLEIKPQMGKSILIAFSLANVPDIDMEAGVLTISLPEELEAKEGDEE